MNSLTVPLADLYAQYLSIKTEIDAAISEVIKTSAFIRGAHVEQFEREFAAAVGVEHCVSCANGTDALYIVMRAFAVRPGDEVITTAHSWIATSETITQANGTVVFCDTDADTYNIDVSQLEAKITPRTVGIIPVHLYGQPADMDAIMRVAKKHRLWVIEDCAQAHLAKIDARLVGTFGNAATYSFYPGKNLGAMGDAGAIVTGDPTLAERMAMFARHGGLRKNDHVMEGINSRMDGLQAAILSVKLKYLPMWTRHRQRIAQQYDRALSGINGIKIPTVAPGAEHVYHLYAIRHENRDRLAKHLSGLGVQTAINYPVALPFVPAYKRLDSTPEQFPNAYHNQSRILSIPMFAELSAMQQDLVIRALSAFSCH